MTENTNNSNYSEYIDYYMLNAWWGNDWIPIAFCCMCGVLFDPETTGNIYKLKKRNVIKEWEKIELYWNSLQTPELQ